MITALSAAHVLKNARMVYMMENKHPNWWLFTQWAVFRAVMAAAICALPKLLHIMAIRAKIRHRAPDVHVEVIMEVVVNG
jgi:hypothetical protein